MLREIKDNEFELLRPCIECLNNHHNEISINFKGTYPRHNVEDKINTFRESVLSGKSKIAVIIDENKIVGVCKIDLDGIFDYLVVLCDYRQKGYGDRLMKWALEEYKRLNINNIELHTVYGNDAIHFYEKYGFKMQSYVMERR